MVRTKIILLLVVFVFSFAGSASAATIEDATVNLYCRIKTSGRTYSTTGSGVFIHESGIILTNAHVAQYFLLATSTGRTTGRCVVRDGSTARDRYRASLVYLSPKWAQAIVETTEKKQPHKGTGEYDFALLRIMEAERGKLPDRFPALAPALFSIPLEEGEEISVAGYPAEGLNFKAIQKKLKYKTATSTITSIQSFTRPHQDLISLSATALSASGVSGGPIIRSNELAGIAVTVSESSKKEKRGLRAITLSYIDRALRAETGYSLLNFISVNTWSVNSFLPPFSDLKKTIEKTLRNTRE